MLVCMSDSSETARFSPVMPSTVLYKKASLPVPSCDARPSYHGGRTEVTGPTHMGQSIDRNDPVYSGE